MEFDGGICRSGRRRAGGLPAGGRLRLPKPAGMSLTERPGIARKLSSLVPFYEYDETGFFRADGAPDEIAMRRRDGFLRLAAITEPGS
jgi:glutamate-1-semialdehyde 2,1-aminomutase